MQLRGVAPGRVGQVVTLDLDDRKVGQRIGADHLGRKNPAIAHGDANVGGAIDHVVVGDDVAVGRDDHAAAQSVLNARLLPLRHLLSEELAEGAEELLQCLHARRRLGHVGLCCVRSR